MTPQKFKESINGSVKRWHLFASVLTIFFMLLGTLVAGAQLFERRFETLDMKITKTANDVATLSTKTATDVSDKAAQTAKDVALVTGNKIAESIENHNNDLRSHPILRGQVAQHKDELDSVYIRQQKVLFTLERIEQNQQRIEDNQQKIGRKLGLEL
jgi:hypothetical protein